MISPGKEREEGRHREKEKGWREGGEKREKERERGRQDGEREV